MAFRQHLIDLHWDAVPAAGPQATNNVVHPNFAKRRLLLEWRLDGDDRLYSRWTQVRD